jgi:hypothetical protein
MSNRTPIASFILSASFLAAPVLADDAPAGEPPLGGPPVAKEAAQGKEAFGEKGPVKGNNNKERPFAGMAAERRNLELWRRAFEQLMPDLSPEVQAQVKAIRADLEARTKAFREANADRIRAFEQAARERKESGDAGKKPDPAMAQEMQKLKDSAPKAEEAQQKIWALLTPEQQAKFKEHYDALRQQAEQRKDDRKDAKQGGGATDPMTADPMLPGGEKPGKRPDSKPFNFQDAPQGPASQDPARQDPSRKGDGKPSGK